MKDLAAWASWMTLHYLRFQKGYDHKILVALTLNLDLRAWRLEVVVKKAPGPEKHDSAQRAHAILSSPLNLAHGEPPTVIPID